MTVRRAFIIGGSITSFIGKGHPDFIWKRHPDFGSRENPSLFDYLTNAVKAAFATTGVTGADVDKAYVSNFAGELFCNQGHLGAALIGADSGLQYKPSMRVEGACASGGLAFAAGLDSIRAGSDIILVAGTEVQTTASARTGGDYLARASHYARQRSIDDFTFPALFAKRTLHYREAFPHVTEEDIAHVSVKAYHNANLNPLAHMNSVKVDLDYAAKASDRNPNFLTNEKYKPFLKVTDCSQVSDGGAALLLVSEAGLKKLGKTPADALEVIGLAHTTDNLFVDGDMTVLNTSRTAADRAYAQAGLRPDDIDVAEVHDCFSVTEVMMTEALGFAKTGQGAALAKDGATAIDGSIPVNTGGGLIGFGHPVGATGIKQLLELFRQIKGQCGDYQVPGNPTVGMAINMGGDDKTVVATILRG